MRENHFSPPNSERRIAACPLTPCCVRVLAFAEEPAALNLLFFPSNLTPTSFSHFRRAAPTMASRRRAAACPSRRAAAHRTSSALVHGGLPRGRRAAAAVLHLCRRPSGLQRGLGFRV